MYRKFFKTSIVLKSLIGLVLCCSSLSIYYSVFLRSSPFELVTDVQGIREQSGELLNSVVESYIIYTVLSIELNLFTGFLVILRVRTFPVVLH